MNEQQLERMRSGRGFIAALDQSGGSTPGALAQYGIGKDAYSNDDEMLTLMHEMRSRIARSPSFNGERVLAAILFENTLDRTIDGMPTTKYLWDQKHVIPFLKVDRGLVEVERGVQIMRPIPDLEELLQRGIAQGVFGTKMRSFIKLADEAGIRAVVEQQFAVAAQIRASGLIPILEPEVDIESPEKGKAEVLLKDAILDGLADVPAGELVMLKLSLPDVDNFYSEFVHHERVLRVVALSGGYSRAEANALLARNNGVIASFSRALTEGLSVTQSDEEFDRVLSESIESIYAASNT